MERRRTGFTLIELVVVVVVGVVLALVLLPAAHRARQGSGLQGSINNVRQIMAAAIVYNVEHKGQAPMRGARYMFGQTSGLDAWHFGGKNCDIFWQSYQTGLFDESAYSRPLNQYLSPVRIPVPQGYQNTGSGSTWLFNHGHPTSQQRQSLQVDVFRSPGDVTTYQRQSPNPTPGVSSYDDVGTSYHLNIQWMFQPGLPGGSGITQRLNEGSRRVGQMLETGDPLYVFVSDQMVGRVSVLLPGQTRQGEFGKPNASVVGYADGRAAYIGLVSGATSGPGYTFWLP